ncbi:MAG: sodium-dependent transporter [Oscillospiraceae bacterium]|nr:sodium-dependent transporter [Oscillospiraceae bacterium]
MKEKRGSWSSNLGFLLAAIGSAVGLGNIWSFPFKMGKSGGFTFLIIYIVMVVFVGLIVMVSELSVGRRSGRGVVDTFHMLSEKFKWVGWLCVIASFLILSFYSVLGGYCLYYIIINAAGIFTGMPDSSSFTAMLTSPLVSIGVLVLFMAICTVIVRGGVSGGIEKFNKIGTPALFAILIIVIIRSLTLPNAVEGLKFMFKPGYAVEGGFISEAPDFISVLGIAGGQMFFSLSLAMGIMVTYGSYLDKGENLVKNAGVICIADTLVALLAGVAVIPAAISNGLASGIPVSEIKLNGPNLLFCTLQDVFCSMGAIGGIFGMIFYILVLLAAISSAISFMEVLITHRLDRVSALGKKPNRPRVTLAFSAAVTLLAVLVAACGLGANGIAPADLLGLKDTAAYAAWNDSWLNFMDFFSEGICMPLGAVIASLVVGWELKPKIVLDEVHNGCNSRFFDSFFTFCIKIIVPIVMTFVFAGQLYDFLACRGFAAAKAVCYAVTIAVLVICAVIAVIPSEKSKKSK